VGGRAVPAERGARPTVCYSPRSMAKSDPDAVLLCADLSGDASITIPPPAPVPTVFDATE